MLRTVLVTPGPRCSTGSARCSFSGASAASAVRDLIPLPPEEAQKDPLLGCNILKSFGRESFFGLVVGIDSDANTGERHYHVTYEDEDEEHLRADEVRRLLQPGRPSQGQRPFGAGSPAASSCFGAPGRARGSDAAASCRPSFAASRAATPRQSLASQVWAPTTSGCQGGTPELAGGVGGVGVYWALAGLALLAYMSLSAALGSTPSPPSDAFAFTDSAASPWPLPSNEALLSSLPPAAAGEAFGHAPAWPEPARDAGTQAYPSSRPPGSAPPLAPQPPPGAAAAHSWSRLPERPAQAAAAAAPAPPEASADEAAAEAAAEAEAAPRGADVGSLALTLGRHLARHLAAWAAEAAETESIVAMLAGLAFAVLVLFFRKRRGAGAPATDGSSLAPLLPEGPPATRTPARDDPYQGDTASSSPVAQSPLLPLANALPPLFSPPPLPPGPSTLHADGPAQGGGCCSPAALAQGPPCPPSPFQRVATPARSAASPAAKAARGKRRGDSPEPPSRRTPKTAIRNKFLDLPHRRFRYPSALRKMEEMGFQDTPDLREVLSQCSGNVNQAMSELWQEGL